MTFYEETGKIALGSRLRILSERITEDAQRIYDLYNVGLKPKWFPVFYILSQCEKKSITAIAEEIGHSHPSVSKIALEMSKAGIVDGKKDRDDGRKNLIALTPKGKGLAIKIVEQYTDVNNAIEETLKQTRHNIWNAMEELEFLLDQKSLFYRVQEQKKQRESEKIKIVPYRPSFHKSFKKLNEEWITTYFKMEDADYKSLENPEKYILDKGGHILVALYNNKAVGVCALIKMDNPEYDFELAKMAVSPSVQGKGIGWLLGRAVIEKARSMGTKKIYLESNTILKPAINLYQKLGFRKVSGYTTPYERCNIQMQLELNSRS